MFSLRRAFAPIRIAHNACLGGARSCETKIMSREDIPEGMVYGELEDSSQHMCNSKWPYSWHHEMKRVSCEYDHIYSCTCLFEAFVDSYSVLLATDSAEIVLSYYFLYMSVAELQNTHGLERIKIKFWMSSFQTNGYIAAFITTVLCKPTCYNATAHHTCWQ